MHRRTIDQHEWSALGRATVAGPAPDPRPSVEDAIKPILTYAAALFFAATPNLTLADDPDPCVCVLTYVPGAMSLRASVSKDIVIDELTYGPIFIASMTYTVQRENGRCKGTGGTGHECRYPEPSKMTLSGSVIVHSDDHLTLETGSNVLVIEPNSLISEASGSTPVNDVGEADCGNHVTARIEANEYRRDGDNRPPASFDECQGSCRLDDAFRPNRQPV